MRITILVVAIFSAAMPVVYHPSPVDGYNIVTMFQHRRPRTAVPLFQTNQVSADHIAPASSDDGTRSMRSSAEAAGDCTRRQPASAVASYRLLRTGSGQLLQRQQVQRRASPFDVDEDGIPRLRFGGSYADRWTGILDIDNCVVARQYLSKRDLGEDHSVSKVHITRGIYSTVHVTGNDISDLWLIASIVRTPINEKGSFECWPFHFYNRIYYTTGLIRCTITSTHV